MRKRTRHTLLKILGLFSSVRGYNILMVCVAQYLASIFVLSQESSLRSVLFDDQLFMLVWAGALAIASGYIINGFYDKEKDLINKPLKSMIDRLVGQNTKLTLYFLLNFLSVIVASYVSFRAVLFFSGYIFSMWLYSHRIKKIPFWGNFTSALLAIVPFFAVFIYYKNFETVIFMHALLLFLLILIKDLIKDLENLKGDLLHNYQTIPVKYGERYAKWGISVASLLCLFLIYALTHYFNVGYMAYYLIFTAIMLCLLLTLLWSSNLHKHYILLHNLLKLVLVMGVFSVLLINPERFLTLV
ncbi:geranylgeranylglycerol-phosphate geranylgeranyltransferase [Capnocytophaga sp.]|uniref:geranylgeranylglycerol-phosphate geranylgeranyltransferase n=1 Tax=Capnocytophaga sp. TaxID=44737 RepID=UPI0026DCEC65|nr:geranylgeranylglycerol-phosphate geranylgeranyltransferase [Capnocytophaga sp.]MDO5104333.1 geranylgeranylglycerol-phosphate geranylgeranyltransferase [Capnocytophaga sp.]